MKLKPILIIFLTIVLTLYSTQAIITHNGDIYPTYNTVNGSGSGNSTAEIQNVVNESILNLSNSYGYNWSDVNNIPAGFADGIDNTGSGGKSANDQWLYNDSTNIYQNETYIWTVIYNETETDTLLAAQDACSEITGCVPNAVTNATMNQSTNWSNIDNIPAGFADNIDNEGGNTTTQIRNAVNTSLYYQLIVNFSNILNFPSYVLTSNLLAKVGNWTDEKSNYYTATTVNANLTAQDECSEITNCVVGAITDGNTNWDNSYNFVTNDTMNQSTNWSNIDNIPAGFADGVDNTGSGGKTAATLWLYNDSSYIYYNETYTWENIYNETETDTLLAAQDACSEITGCVEDAVTNATMNQSVNWSNIDNMPAGFSDGIDNTGTGGKSTNDQWLYNDSTNIYQNETYIWEVIYNETEVDSLISSFISYDTNASTECTGDTTYLDGEGNCDDISSVYAPISLTDTNASTECTGTNVLNGDGNCVVNTNSTTEMRIAINSSVYYQILTSYLNIYDLPSYVLTANLLAKVGNWTADQSNYYTATIVNANLTAQDECSEITNCVVGAITDGNTGWDNSYNFVTNDTMNQSTNWSNIDNIPAGFADGVDNTGSGGKSTNDQWLYNDSTDIYQNETYIWEVIYNETEVDSLISSFISYDTNASTECAGDTTYLDGEGNCDDISSVYVIASDWTSIDNYPASCAANTYVTSIGDTLTCVNVVNNTYSVNETTQFGGEVSGTFNNIVLAHDALDDQYYDSESDLTGLLNDNYAAISVTDTNATTECTGDTTYLDGEGNCDDISGVYVQAGDWTTIDNYPASCAADTYMVTIGDTVSCIHVVNNTYSLNQTTNFAGEVTGTFDAMVLDHDALDDQYYDSESDLTTLLDDNYLANNSRANFTTLESLHLTIVSVNITCLNTACTFYINATDECTYYTTGGRECTG